MAKDSKVELGRTKCDFCDQPSRLVVGNYVVCEVHAYRARTASGVKSASDASDIPLKAAPIAMSPEHRE